MKCEEEVRAEAEAHWDYTEKIILDMLRLVRTVYVEVFIHGVRHGREDVEK